MVVWFGSVDASEANKSYRLDLHQGCFKVLRKIGCVQSIVRARCPYVESNDGPYFLSLSRTSFAGSRWPSLAVR